MLLACPGMKIVHGEGGTNSTISLQQCQQCSIDDWKSIPSTRRFQSPLVTAAWRAVKGQIMGHAKRGERRKPETF